MQEDDVRALLRADCERVGGQSVWAARAGVSASYVSDVLQKRRSIGASILAALGLRRVVTFEPSDDRVNQQDKTPQRKPTPRGCICPPGAEATCQGVMCPRRAFEFDQGVIR